MFPAVGENESSETRRCLSAMIIMDYFGFSKGYLSNVSRSVMISKGEKD